MVRPALAPLVLVVAGCSPAGRPAAGAGPSEPAPTKSAAATPPATGTADRVRGTFRGKSFEAKVGLAREDAADPAKKDFRLWIFDRDATCENLGDPKANSAISVTKLPADTRFLSARVAWETGVAVELGSHNAGLHYVDADGNELGGGAQSGRIEVLEAAREAGKRARVRVAAKAKDTDLAGTMELVVCK